MEVRLLAVQAGINVEAEIIKQSVGDCKKKRVLRIKTSAECCSKKCKCKEY